MKQQNEAKRILEDLADDMLMRRFLSEVRDLEQVGQTILRLSPEQRAALQKLKSEDIANARWPRPDDVNLEKMPRRRG